GLAADQGRLVVDALGLVDGLVDGSGIVTVHVAHHVPAVGFETLRGVVGEPVLDVAVDGDAVVVPEGDQLAQAQGTGQGAGFVGDAFHHAAVAHEHVGVVIDDVVTGAVELAGQGALGQ